MGTLCAQHLLQLYADTFETVQVFCHCQKMCMWFEYNPQINLYHFYLHCELSHFSGANTIIVYVYWVSCVRNSSNSFTPIVLKLYRCFCHGPKICMWFEYNPQINSNHFFRILNSVIFQARILSKGIDSGYLVCATPPTVLCRSF